MKFLSRLAVLSAVLGASLSAPNAHALRISLVGAANHTTPEIKPSWDFTPGVGFGGGALVEFGMLPVFGIETGVLLVPRKYEVNSFYRWQVTQDMIQVPLVLRAHLGNILSVGFGGYYAKYRGDVEYRYARNTNAPPISGSHYSQGLTDDDYGWLASLAIYAPIAPMTRLVVDGRYVQGVKDNDLTLYEKTFRDAQILFGIQFGL